MTSFLYPEFLDVCQKLCFSPFERLEFLQKFIDGLSQESCHTKIRFQVGEIRWHLYIYNCLYSFLYRGDTECVNLEAQQVYQRVSRGGFSWVDCKLEVFKQLVYCT